MQSTYWSAEILELLSSAEEHLHAVTLSVEGSRTNWAGPVVYNNGPIVEISKDMYI
jgi:hypothetical protein